MPYTGESLKKKNFFKVVIKGIFISTITKR